MRWTTGESFSSPSLKLWFDLAIGQIYMCFTTSQRAAVNKAKPFAMPIFITQQQQSRRERFASFSSDMHKVRGSTPSSTAGDLESPQINRHLGSGSPASENQTGGKANLLQEDLRLPGCRDSRLSPAQMQTCTTDIWIHPTNVSRAQVPLMQTNSCNFQHCPGKRDAVAVRKELPPFNIIE